MDWLTFIDHLIEHLVWPLVAVGFLLINRKAIANRLGSLQNVDIAGVVKAAFANVKASEELDKAEAIHLSATVVAIPKGTGTLTAVPKEARMVDEELPLGTLREVDEARHEVTPRTVTETRSVHSSDGAPSVASTGWETLMRVARNFQSLSNESKVSSAWQDVKNRLVKMIAETGQRLDPADFSDDWVMSKVAEEEILDTALMNAVRELHNIRYLMATSRWEPTAADANDFASNAERACFLLDEYLKRMTK